MAHRWSRTQWWQLVDPLAEQPAVAETMEALLDLATGATPDRGRITIGSPAVDRFIERHRVAAMIPLDLVEPEHRDRLRAVQVEVAAAQLRIRSVAAGCLQLLSEAGIETRVLKGLATAELDYPKSGMRHTGDVDLAVAPDQLDDAVRLLHGHGCRDHPTRFDPVLLYGWVLDTPEGIEIDLHTRLFRRSPLGDSLLAEPGEPLATVPGVAMPAEHRLVHAAGHFIIAPPGTRRMSGFLDISRLLTRPGLDLERTRRFARALHVEALVGAGIRVEAELSGRHDVLAALDAWEPLDWLERRTRLVPRRRLVLDHVGRYKEVPAGHRLAYLPAWLLPTAQQRALFRRSIASAVTRRTARFRGPRVAP